MATAYLYVLGSSSSADSVDCTVPWLVDASEIFFGPCKKRLRERLRRQLLNSTTDRADAAETIMFAGFNALPSSPDRVRKLVWAGRVKEAMSFGRAWLDLRGEKYEAMRSHRSTPVHLEPIDASGRPSAYRHFGHEHESNDAWLKDVLTPQARRTAQFQREAKTVHLSSNVSWWEGFPRDICFLLENLFFADGAGLEIDDDLVRILREAQPNRQIDDVAIFGLNGGGTPDGRCGGFLELTDGLADRFVKWIADRHVLVRRGNPDPLKPWRGVGASLRRVGAARLRRSGLRSLERYRATHVKR